MRVRESGRTVRLRRCAALLLALLAGGSGLASETADRLENEDVVKMLVAGTPVSEVLEAIRTRPVEFDVSREMLVELRGAGVPTEVVDAMVERQTEIDRAARGESEEIEEKAAAPSLTVAFRKPSGQSDATTPLLFFPRRVGEELAQILGLGDTEEERTVTDVAVLLACRTGRHVPDYWRSKSPLGRDFVSTPRHRVLAFHTGATEVEPDKLPEALRRRRDEAAPFLALELPAQLEADVDLIEEHDLVLGVAIQVRDRFMLVVFDERQTEAVEGESIRLEALVREEVRGEQIVLEAAFLDDDGA